MHHGCDDPVKRDHRILAHPQASFFERRLAAVEGDRSSYRKRSAELHEKTCATLLSIDPVAVLLSGPQPFGMERY